METRAGAVRGVNLRIRAAALRLDGLTPETRWDFLCECGSPDCMEFVRLPMAEFEALLELGGTVLAGGHWARRLAASPR